LERPALGGISIERLWRAPSGDLDCDLDCDLNRDLEHDLEHDIEREDTLP
jgi:hypothetical protein